MGVRHDARTQLSMLYPCCCHGHTQREKYIADGGATGSFFLCDVTGKIFFLSASKSRCDVAKWREKRE